MALVYACRFHGRAVAIHSHSEFFIILPYSACCRDAPYMHSSHSGVSAAFSLLSNCTLLLFVVNSRPRSKTLRSSLVHSYQVLLGEVNAGLSTTQVVVKELKASSSVQDQMQFLEEVQPYR